MPLLGTWSELRKRRFRRAHRACRSPIFCRAALAAGLLEEPGPGRGEAARSGRSGPQEGVVGVVGRALRRSCGLSGRSSSVGVGDLPTALGPRRPERELRDVVRPMRPCRLDFDGAGPDRGTVVAVEGVAVLHLHLRVAPEPDALPRSNRGCESRRVATGAHLDGE